MGLFTVFQTSKEEVSFERLFPSRNKNGICPTPFPGTSIIHGEYSIAIAAMWSKKKQTIQGVMYSE